jgi:hypothetical protein
VYFEEAEGGQQLIGYRWDQGGQAKEPIELPEGIELGMPYSDAAALYRDGAYNYDSLELDGVVLQETPSVVVIAEHSEDGSAPITQGLGWGDAHLQLRPVRLSSAPTMPDK